VVGLPQVEPLEPVIDRVHQADAELAVDNVPRAQQPVIGQPRHNPELVRGDLADLGPFGRGRARRSDQEPDPAPVGGGHPVERWPILPALTLAARLLGKADQIVPQLAGQPLRLTPSELQRRVLGPVTVTPPGQVIPPQRTRVVLQLNQVQAAPAQHQQVDLVPLAVPVAELEIRPRAEGRSQATEIGRG